MPIPRVFRFMTAATTIILCASGLSACAAGERNPEGLVLRTAGTVLPVAPATDAYMEALLTGTLVKGPGGCLFVESNGVRSLVVWRHGSTLSSNGRSVVNGKSSLSVGDYVEIGGGFGTPPNSLPIPDACLTESPEAFFSSAP